MQIKHILILSMIIITFSWLFFLIGFRPLDQSYVSFPSENYSVRELSSAEISHYDENYPLKIGNSFYTIALEKSTILSFVFYFLIIQTLFILIVVCLAYLLSKYFAKKKRKKIL